MILQDYSLKNMEETIPLDRQRTTYTPQLIAVNTVRNPDPNQEYKDPWGREVNYIKSTRKNALDIAKYLAHVSRFPKNCPRNSPRWGEDRYCSIARFGVQRNVSLRGDIEVERVSDNNYRIKINTLLVNPKNISKLKKRMKLK